MRLKEDGEPTSILKTKAEDLRDATLLLLIAAQGEADLQAGRVLPQDQALARVRLRLKI